MNEKIVEKMKKFSKVAENTGDEEYEHMLNSWGKQIVKSEAWSKYQHLPMTQELVTNLVRTVKTINQKLVTKRMGEVEQATYLADKQRCLWLIKHLSHNFTKDLKLIELAIDNELNELEN